MKKISTIALSNILQVIDLLSLIFVGVVIAAFTLCTPLVDSVKQGEDPGQGCLLNHTSCTPLVDGMVPKTIGCP